MNIFTRSATIAILIMAVALSGFGQAGTGTSFALGSIGHFTSSNGSAMCCITFGSAISGVNAETRKPMPKPPTLASVLSTAYRIKASDLAPASYIATAKAIGMDSASVDEARMTEAISNLGLMVFDYKQVDEFLYNKALAQGTNVRWVWKPMRSKDIDPIKGSGGAWSLRPQMGFVYPDLYTGKIPFDVMKIVARVLECEPDALPLVSDYEVVKPDPFLAITTPKLLGAGNIWIVANWDEPDFKGRAKPVALSAIEQ
jgi:hypothetical protein